MANSSSTLTTKIKLPKIISLSGCQAAISMKPSDSEMLQLIPTTTYKVTLHQTKTDIRTGSFSQISENYLIESKSAKSRESSFTTNSFDTEMIQLRNSIETKLSKSISFFQGIYAGMALLFTITLNLSSSVSRELVRVEDQSIRVISLLTTLGSFFSAIRAYDRRKLTNKHRPIHKTTWYIIINRLTIQMPGPEHPINDMYN